MRLADPDPAAPVLAEFRQLRRTGDLTPDEARRLAQHAAALFRARYAEDGAFVSDAITLLVELATHPDAELARTGAGHLFPELVEWSADWFSPDYCRLYDRLFAQVIDICRHLPQSRELHFSLYGYGISSIDDMLARRARQLAPRPPFDPAGARISKVLIPSRVTFGAEVAVTGVILRAAAALYPDAEPVILGAPAVGQLFAGAPGVRVADIGYPRGGALLARLNSWTTLTQIVADELAGLDLAEYLIIDPDSRLTQLGLLPLATDDSRALFFESRSYGGDGGETISTLTARWLAEQFKGLEGAALLPFVSLSEAHGAFTAALRGAFEAGDARPAVAVSFGVGGNEAKRVGEAFEHDLLAALLDAGARVLLAKGVGDEVLRVERHLSRLSAERKINIVEVEASAAGDLPPAGQLQTADVIAWCGELGAFAALIAAGDVYIGYDSGGQHIAAAQGVPVIDIFADDSIPMVTTRWTPTGPAAVRVIEHYKAPGETLARVMAAYRENFNRE
ncbi:MAG: hypothetical protein JXB47_07790 [Anaerolineae bacterium]|nr:hypothetical protein [Anaerolineae bacterium]